MKNNNLSTLVSYLPLQKFHIIPIIALDPASLKTSAKKTKCDREKIKHNTLLNAISKALGIKGGFSEYQQIYNSDLLPFMKKHGLKKRVNLLEQRKAGFDKYLHPNITYQKLSERLFFSGYDLPEKIFTGYNFDFKNRIDDGRQYFEDIVHGEGNTHTLKDDNSFFSSSIYSVGKLQDIIEHNIKVARSNPTIIVDCPYNDKPLKSFFDFINLEKKNKKTDDIAIQAGINRYNQFANRTLLDVVVGSFIRELRASFNLLGDSLVSPTKSNNVVELYLGNGDHTALNKDKELVTLKFNLFRELIDQSEDGWVEVLPFNKSLIFLRGCDGQYDFVFKNQRDNFFDHQILDQSLKRSDIPSCMQDYQFHRWHYFEYQGWRNMDSHNAENLFYAQGNKTGAYPGLDKVIQTYHEENNNFIPKLKRSHLELPGFKKVMLNNKSLMISELITIDELYLFKEANIDYFSYRVGDNLDSVNNEIDTQLPSTVTWFDALAYINWFEKEVNTQIRLLNLEEYLELRSSVEIFSDSSSIDSNLKFSVDGNVFSSHPPYMNESDFQNLICRLGNTETVNSDSGLCFLKSNFFAEWLFEGTCIRSGNLKSFYNDDFHLRSSGPRSSTGKYKGLKTGFRLCYELESH